MLPNILFLHIPKTAGQSVHEYLVSVFGQEAVCPARVNVQLQQYSEAELQQYRVFSGHFDWNRLDFVAEPKFTFTILRDPIERIVSFYLYLRREAKKLDAYALDLPENSGKKAILSLTPDEYFADQTLSLRTFIDDHYDNFYTYYFAGRAYDARKSVLASLPVALGQEEKANMLVKLAVENLAKIDKIYSIHDWQQGLSESLWTLTNLDAAKSCLQSRDFNLNKGDSLDLEARLADIQNLGATHLTFSTITKFALLDRALLKERFRTLEFDLDRSFEILARCGNLSLEDSPPLLTLQDRVDFLISQAKVQHYQSDWQSAIKLLNQALELQKDCWEAQQLLGDALFNLADWEAAIAAYRRALELNPRFDWTYHNLAVALNRLEQFEAARFYCEKLAELFPEFWQVHRDQLEMQRPEGTTGEKRQAESAAESKSESESESTAADPESKSESKSESESTAADPDLPAWQSEQDLFELVSAALTCPQLKALSEFQQHCSQIRSQLNSPKLGLAYGCWLAPSMLYLEGNIEGCWVLGEKQVMLSSPEEGICEIGTASFFQISGNQVSAVVLFDRDIYTQPYKAFHITPFLGKTPILIEGSIATKAYSLEFIDWLNSKPEYQKHLIRESISRWVIQSVPEQLQPEAGELLYKLQHFLRVALAAANDPKVPFTIFIEQVIPVGFEGVFLAGWMNDPYNMLEEIEVISALGFSMAISSSQVHRISRDDVVKHLQSTPYGNFATKPGFCAYAQVPPEVYSQFGAFAELHSFRFKTKLRGRITFDVIPDVKHHDVFAARSLVMQIVPADEAYSELLETCIAPAATKLQKLCMKQVAVREVVSIGNPLPEPLISIIIPLYKQLDFLKVQIATLANDASIKQKCEIIYVLDSPEQQKEVREFLLDHCLLYELPVKLVIMARNSGYAAANNTGAAYARGEYLILLNSDVFHRTDGWAVKMAEFYNANPEIGTLAPKLVYEDDSIQHAGMYFERARFPFWITLHYYKGFPNSYRLAQESRSVPAVTGACLMIRKSLYNQVGGMSTDYIIGDFEDSDLCFKCTALGYQSWYFAGIELYHLERQSMPLNNVYSGSLAWQCNARLHEGRWQGLVEQLMQGV